MKEEGHKILRKMLIENKYFSDCKRISEMLKKCRLQHYDPHPLVMFSCSFKQLICISCRCDENKHTVFLSM